MCQKLNLGKIRVLILDWRLQIGRKLRITMWDVSKIESRQDTGTYFRLAIAGLSEVEKDKKKSLENSMMATWYPAHG
jgi:hypothetical protein